MTVAAQGDALVRKLVTFGRILREGGAEVGPGRLQDALGAMDVVDVTSREEVRSALRCSLISRLDDIELFEAAFTAYWERAPSSAPSREPDGDPSASVAGNGGASPARVTEVERTADASGEGDEGGVDEESAGGMAWSAVERLRELDFAEYTPEELRKARRLMTRIGRASPRRRSRRLEAAPKGRRLDERRILRGAMRTAGWPLERHWRRKRLVPRQLVFLVDVSGSMEPYARATIMYLQAAVRGTRSVEAFSFGTRLTRMTRQLDDHDPDRALRAATRAVPDWAGGTRIGENLKAFNDVWGRTGLSRGATVTIVSDGWERGDPALLLAQIIRLHRAAHTLMWVNPLAGDPDYEPLAQGMAAALPHVDVFLPGHNLRSFEALAEALEALPTSKRHPDCSRTPSTTRNRMRYREDEREEGT